MTEKNRCPGCQVAAVKVKEQADEIEELKGQVKKFEGFWSEAQFRYYRAMNDCEAMDRSSCPMSGRSWNRMTGLATGL
jgi:hypothetical protein